MKEFEHSSCGLTTASVNQVRPNLSAVADYEIMT